MRAERAKLKSCKDDETIAQGKRSAALGYGRKMIPSFSLTVLRASGAQNRKGKRGWVGGGSLPRAAASAALPWADMWLSFQGAGKANRVAGRIDLPAPTPPVMRVRGRRFQSD